MSAAKTLVFNVTEHGDENYVTIATEPPPTLNLKLEITSLELELEHDFGSDPYNRNGLLCRTGTK